MSDSRNPVMNRLDAGMGGSVESELPGKELCPPFWYGLASFFLVPLAAFFCISMGVGLILCWPIVPFVFYFQMRDEIRVARNEQKA